MILIANSSATERAALAALCASRGWITSEHADARSALRAMEKCTPRVVLTRQTLSDGYSDDLIRAVRQPGGSPGTRLLVLASANLQPAAEARQILIGADCVLRDPIRGDVLCAYLERFLGQTQLPGPTRSRRLSLARAILDPSERKLTFRNRSIRLTPREVSLCEALLRHRGQVIPYETLFLEVLDRKYQGETSNLRVLLGKLAASFRLLGLDLRRWVEVIPKSGHRLLAHPLRRTRPGRRRGS